MLYRECQTVKILIYRKTIETVSNFIANFNISYDIFSIDFVNFNIISDKYFYDNTLFPIFSESPQLERSLVKSSYISRQILNIITYDSKDVY